MLPRYAVDKHPVRGLLAAVSTAPARPLSDWPRVDAGGGSARRAKRRATGGGPACSGRLIRRTRGKADRENR